ncbi:MAG: GNAT family N-acetyltransferase [Roseovarius sp.]
MSNSLRPATDDDCTALTALATRSKAHWGYDAAFMQACQDELAVTPDQINDHMIVAVQQGRITGFACLEWRHGQTELGAMYVDPDVIGSGVGRCLFEWCVDHARAAGATALLIDADPNAEPFYVRLGATRIGVSPSESIPGRMLPQLTYPL